jgi:hypothetical protein
MTTLMVAMPNVDRSPWNQRGAVALAATAHDDFALAAVGHSRSFLRNAKIACDG